MTEQNITRRASNLSHAEVAALVNGQQQPFVLEIGAHEGHDTLLLLEALPTATIFCFEPDPRCRAAWTGRIRNSRATLVPRAIANVWGFHRWYASHGRIDNGRIKTEDWNYSSSLLKPSGHLQRDPSITFSDSDQVETMPLDGWYREHEPRLIDFIWADVQGAEALLILGGQNALAHTRWLYTECHQQQAADPELYERAPDLRAILAFLPSFDLEGIYGENLLLRNRNLVTPEG